MFRTVSVELCVAIGLLLVVDMCSLAAASQTVLSECNCSQGIFEKQQMSVVPSPLPKEDLFLQRLQLKFRDRPRRRVGRSAPLARSSCVLNGE